MKVISDGDIIEIKASFSEISKIVYVLNKYLDSDPHGKEIKKLVKQLQNPTIH